MSKKKDKYIGEMITTDRWSSRRVFVGCPMTGLLRSEWVMARYGQVIPCNWSTTEMLQWIQQSAPLKYLVADARNLVVKSFIEKGFEWLLFIDHDVILPPGTFLKLNERMIENKVPIWGGLYFTKSVPSEPLVYRGRGNGYFNKWKLGDEVWVDGLGMGCTLIHNSILKVLWKESEDYQIGNILVKRVFRTPAETTYDPETNTWNNSVGTEDLEFYKRIIQENVLQRAGWKSIARKKYPFLVDTSLFCRHIDFSGRQFPSQGEELQFVKKEVLEDAKNYTPERK